MKEKKMKEVHLVTSSQNITAFMETDRSQLMCFRCGENGHVRHQCLTFKVRRCWHYDQGSCNDPHCPFAHGDAELRTPWRARCVRVVKQQGKLICIGCNSTGHTFRKCPMNQSVMLI